MKRNILIGTLVLTAGALLAADAKDQLTAAAKKLADKANYSWKQTMENAGGGGMGPMNAEGKIDNGTIWVSMAGRNNTTEAVKKGEKAAIKTQEGWQSVEEMSGQQGRGRFAGMMMRNYRPPATQIEDLAKQMKEIKQEGDVYSGDLTEDGAKAQIFPRRPGADGGNGPEISGAKGSAKIWVKDGLPVKYEVRVKGSISFTGNDREIDRTTTVDIQNVGSTKVEVPEEAKKKLE